MSVSDQVQTALRSAKPGSSLRNLVGELAQTGLTESEIYDLFDDYRVQQHERGDIRDDDEENLLDLLDALTGNCHPSAQLLP